MINKVFCTKIEKYIGYYLEEQGKLPSVERIAKLFGFPVEEIQEHLDYMGRKDILPETK